MISAVTQHMLPHLSGVPHLHVNRPLVVQRRLKNIQKSLMHGQSCCFATLNPLLFALVVDFAVVVDFKSSCRHVVHDVSFSLCLPMVASNLDNSTEKPLQNYIGERKADTRAE